MTEIQILLSIAILITTLFIITTGIQLFLLFKDLKKIIKKINFFLNEDNFDKKNYSSEKKELLKKKRIFLENIINKIKFNIENNHNNKKIFFKKNKIDI